jgi:hypothetical protein
MTIAQWKRSNEELKGYTWLTSEEAETQKAKRKVDAQELYSEYGFLDSHVSVFSSAINSLL